MCRASSFNCLVTAALGRLSPLTVRSQDQSLRRCDRLQDCGRFRTSKTGHFHTVATGRVQGLRCFNVYTCIQKIVPISFDTRKSERNIAERGLSFQLVEEFEWDSTLVGEDVRRDYGERRFQALGMITGRLHALAFTPRAGRVHVISLRKANRRESRLYEAQDS